MKVEFREANDTAISDFIRKSGVFPNGAKISSDRIRAVEADADYPFRHIVDNSFIDYEAKTHTKSTAMFEYSINNKEPKTIEINKSVLNGENVGQVLYDIISLNIEHAVEQITFDISDVKTQTQVRQHNEQKMQRIHEVSFALLDNTKMFFNMYQIQQDAAKAIEDSSEFPFKHQQGENVIEYTSLPSEKDSDTVEFVYSLNGQESELMTCPRKDVPCELSEYILLAALKEHNKNNQAKTIHTMERE